MHDGRAEKGGTDDHGHGNAVAGSINIPRQLIKTLDGKLRIEVVPDNLAHDSFELLWQQRDELGPFVEMLHGLPGDPLRIATVSGHFIKVRSGHRNNIKIRVQRSANPLNKEQRLVDKEEI